MQPRLLLQEDNSSVFQGLWAFLPECNGQKVTTEGKLLVVPCDLWVLLTVPLQWSPVTSVSKISGSVNAMCLQCLLLVGLLGAWRILC